MHFVAPCMSWSRMQMWRLGTTVAVFVPCVLWWWVRHVGSPSRSSHAWCGAAVTVDVVCVLWLWSLCPVLWWWVRCMGSWSQSLCYVCHGHRCGALGHGCGLCACGMGPQSPLMQHVCYGYGLYAMLWSWVQCIGLWLWSLHAWCRAVVAVNAVRVSQSQSSCRVLWLWARRIRSWLQVPLLCCVHCGCHLCAVCGVTVALSMPCGVSPVPLLCRVWCCGCEHCATCGVCGYKRQ